ncbi:MAG: NADH-ubiquinone oxidoreductase-F iron-sulfur binding region domain-containing protein [Actinomycetes bacterium]
MTSITPRLLPPDPVTGRALDMRSLSAHEAHFGPAPRVAVATKGRPESLIDEISASGLRGRGGGWFPTARKMHAVVESAAARKALSSGRKAVVIANAMEGEPASSKDAILLSHSPHLVIEGIQAAAATIGASNAYLAVHRGSPLIPILDEVLAQRSGIDRVPVELITPPARYVASEESALTHWAGDGEATPVYGARPFQRGMNGRPTLVQNAETLAHIALIARNGGAWFASAGVPDAPGTTLVSVGGAVAQPGVIEVATGSPVTDILNRCGGVTGSIQGFLTGGYGGAWVSTTALQTTTWAPDPVREAGGVIGAGILLALGSQHCPLEEMARVAMWMAGESAGQCGPCRFGLPTVADDLATLAGREGSIQDIHRLNERLALIVNRGGCKHPDGTARFISTGIHTFHAEVAHHANGHCSASSNHFALPIPEGRAVPVNRAGKDFK